MKQKLGMKANRAELFSRFGILLIFALVVLSPLWCLTVFSALTTF